MNDKVQLPIAKGVTVESDGGEIVALFFKTDNAPGFVGVGIPRQELARTVSLFIQHASKVAAKKAPEDFPDQMTVTPIMASHMAMGKGRSETEALLSFRVGNLDLTVAVELSNLTDMCRTLQTTTQVTAQRKPQ